jgi:hypothetical protein
MQRPGLPSPPYSGARGESTTGVALPAQQSIVRLLYRGMGMSSDWSQAKGRVEEWRGGLGEALRGDWLFRLLCRRWENR